MKRSSEEVFLVKKHPKMNDVNPKLVDDVIDNSEIKGLKQSETKEAVQKFATSKKLVIKNFGKLSLKFANKNDSSMCHFVFKEKPQIPENYLDETWLKLSEAVRAIQNSKPVTTSLEELYDSVQNMCSYKRSSFVYQELQSMTKLCVNNIISHLVERDSDNLSFLKLIEKCWKSFCNQMVI